jgi:hypothetical protein
VIVDMGTTDPDGCIAEILGGLTARSRGVHGNGVRPMFFLEANGESRRAE